MTALERGRLLLRLGESVLAHHEELSQLESRDTGKPMSTAPRRHHRAGRATSSSTAARPTRCTARPSRSRRDYSVQLIRETGLGVTAHIIPWNYPAQMFGRSVAPALAMGNASVVKPAEDACLSIVRVAELALEVGFPAGALNIVTGLGEEAGRELVAPSRHQLHHLHGFQRGRRAESSRPPPSTRSSACWNWAASPAHIVFDDAELQAGHSRHRERHRPTNAGQTCTAGSRLLVQKGIYADFMKALAEEFLQGARWARRDMGPDLRPLWSNKAQFDRVNRYIAKGLADGLKVAAEGAIADGVPTGGYFVKPTLFQRPVARQHAADRRDLRTRAGGAALRYRGRRHPPGQRHRLWPLGRRLDRERRAPATHRARHQVRPGLHQRIRRGRRRGNCRLAASRKAATDARRALSRWKK